MQEFINPLKGYTRSLPMDFPGWVPVGGAAVVAILLASGWLDWCRRRRMLTCIRLARRVWESKLVCAKLRPLTWIVAEPKLPMKLKLLPRLKVDLQAA